LPAAFSGKRIKASSFREKGSICNGERAMKSGKEVEQTVRLGDAQGVSIQAKSRSSFRPAGKNAGTKTQKRRLDSWLSMISL
jgi:hypothetical protein